MTTLSPSALYRKPSKSFLIKYFPNILSVFDKLWSGDCREVLTYLAAVVTTAGKFISGLSKTFVLSGLPRRECNPRSFFFSLFFLFLSPISYPPLLPHSSSSSPPSDLQVLLLADISPRFLCVCLCALGHQCVCVYVWDKFLSTVQELCAVTHFLPEAKTLRRGRTRRRREVASLLEIPSKKNEQRCTGNITSMFVNVVYTEHT